MNRRAPRLVKKPAPVITYWQVRSPVTRKTATCLAFPLSRGFELRLQHSADDVIDVEAFHGPDAREVMDLYAAQLLQEVLGSGFQQVLPGASGEPH